MKDKSSYLFSADIIRALAIIGVVIIHSAIAIYARPDFFGGISWWFAMSLNSISRSAVPLFIMLSGYLILSKQESFKSSLKRTFNRLVVPLVSWVIIYNLFFTKSIATDNSPISLIKQIYSVDVFVFYFIIILIGLYVFSSPISAYLNKVNFRSQKFLMLFFLFLGALQTIVMYFLKECSSVNALTMWIPYLGLFIAGFVLGKSDLVNKKLMWLGLFGIGLISTLALNYYHYFSIVQQGILIQNTHGCISHYSDYFLSINVLLMSIPAFMLLLSFNYEKIRNTILGKLISSISKAAFGIFLIHILIISIFESNIQIFQPLWLNMLIKFAVVFIISYIITLILMRIPILRRVIGMK